MSTLSSVGEQAARSSRQSAAPRAASWCLVAFAVTAAEISFIEMSSLLPCFIEMPSLLLWFARISFRPVPNEGSRAERDQESYIVML
jgi:hypothetical protein